MGFGNRTTQPTSERSGARQVRRKADFTREILARFYTACPLSLGFFGLGGCGAGGLGGGGGGSAFFRLCLKIIIIGLATASGAWGMLQARTEATTT